MGSVIYSINGKRFLDYEVHISESEGLLDKLKPKPRKTYDWAEYHGKAVDTDKPKYEEREIVLKGWIEGSSWEEMKRRFETLLSEFDKEGLVRLVVEFGSVLVYDVYLADGVDLKKQFREGKTYGFFTLKMKEPSPIKKVLKYNGTDLQISFRSLSWVDINIDGVSETHKGEVNFRKTLKRGMHYISISGNIDEITNLQTNAEEI